MYIKNNRLYDNGVSFEIPQGARINISANGGVAIFKSDEPWYINVDLWNGPFGEKELGEYIADLCENNSIGALQTTQKTVNNVFMRQVSYEFEGYPEEPACAYILNERLVCEDFWMHCRVWCTVYDCGKASGKRVADHPIISAFINSVRKEPFEESQEIPACVVEMRKARRNQYATVAKADEDVDR